MTGWDVFTGRPAVPPGILAELTALRAALPSYDVIVTSHSPGYRFEAIRRRTDDPGPWCVISSDPADLWRELADRAPPAAADGDRVDLVLLSARLTVCSYTARVPPLHSAKARPTGK